MSEEICFSEYYNNLAWRVYKYFIAHKHLLNDEKNKNLYEKARKIALDDICSRCEGCDVEVVELAMKLVAQKVNKERPDRFIVIDELMNIL